MGHSHGIKWSDELIENELKYVMDALNISRMPSNSEIKMVNGHSLSNAISRNGGFRMWAEKLNLETKESETSFGNEYELIVKEILEELGYQVEKMTTKHSYDLLVNDNIKIDIKTARYYKQKDGSKFHSCNLEKRYHNCDIFICVGINENEDIEKVLVIPSKYLMNKKQLSIGVTSSYDRLNKRFDYIEKYVQFYNEI
ncbi:hypothetical protein [Clostridium sp.]|uniref:hypothetical protein n=1 Tax=Clostridium sp. TaxID=1506 RepID=UPI003F3D91E9